MASAEGSRAAQPEKPAPASQVEAGKAAPEPVAGGLSLLTAVAGAVLLTVLIASLDETYESVQEHDGLAGYGLAMKWVVLPLTALTVLVVLLRDLRGRKRRAAA